MSGEKNDLFNSLSSFFKLCQLSSRGSVQPACSSAREECYAHQECYARQTEGKAMENPFFRSCFSSCHSCSGRKYKSTTAVCSSCFDCHLLPCWEMLSPPHATESRKPFLSLSSRYSPRASPFLGGARERVDRLLTVKRKRKHFSAFAAWIGGRREFRQQMRTGATAHYFGSPPCLQFISLFSWGQQGSNPWPLGALGQCRQHATSWSFSSLWDSSVDPGIRARRSQAAFWKPTYNPKASAAA